MNEHYKQTPIPSCQTTNDKAAIQCENAHPLSYSPYADLINHVLSRLYQYAIPPTINQIVQLNEYIIW